METTTQAAVRAPDAATGDERRWHRIRQWAAAGYVAALVLVVAVAGVPTDRGSLLLIILGGLAIPCLGRGWRVFGKALLDWLPFTAVLVLYDVSRGIADGLGMPLHVSDIAAADRDLFGGTVPTVWLQQHFLNAGAPHWYDALATLVYTSHFIATPVVAAVLWLRSREAWKGFAARVIALSVAGLVTYVLFPAAPPWYAAREGVIAPVVRASSRGWQWLHVNHAGNLLSEGQAASNPVAAMPSLHMAFATLIALYVASRLRSRWRFLIVLYPLVMGLSLMYLGEHYVIDLAVGVIYALAVHHAFNAWTRRRTRSPALTASPE